MIGKYTARQQLQAMRDLSRERGDSWATGMTRAEYNAICLAALVARYGQK